MSASILILDDDEEFRRTLAFILKRAGYSVTTTEHPQNAMETIQNGYFDLVISDIKMPDMDGLALLAEIRKTHPHLPVMILTGYGGMDSAVEAMRLNARDYFTKPIEPVFFLERVQKILAEEEALNRRSVIVSQIRTLLEELEQIDHPTKNSGDQKTSLVPMDSTRFLQKDEFTLDLKAQQVDFRGHPLSLPPSTFNYLVTLIRHSPRPVSYEALVMEAQGYSLASAEARSISRWQIYQLRHALEPDPDHPMFVLTVRNMGYRLITSSGKSSRSNGEE
jgi:DNA-binding response OmpR family regulator